jgi:phosphate/sulfate permease
MTRRVHVVDVVAADAPLLLSLVTRGMVAGNLLAGRRVTHVLAEKVTRMDHRGGFAASLVTASLVVDYGGVARYLWSSQ